MYKCKEAISNKCIILWYSRDNGNSVRMLSRFKGGLRGGNHNLGPSAIVDGQWHHPLAKPYYHGTWCLLHLLFTTHVLLSSELYSRCLLCLKYLKKYILNIYAPEAHHGWPFVSKLTSWEEKRWCLVRQPRLIVLSFVCCFVCWCFFCQTNTEKIFMRRAPHH